MTTVRISTKSARVLRDMLGIRSRYGTLEQRAIDELEHSLAKSPKKREATRAKRQRREAKAKTKRDRTAEVRAAVMARAGELCECSCGGSFTDLNPMELDHFFSRGRAESVETCWGLRRSCHRLKTNNNPSARFWLLRFLAHCERYGYAEEALRARGRLAFVTARTELTEGRP